MGRRFALTFLSLLILVGCGGKKNGTPTSCKGDVAYLINNSCQRLHWDSLPVILTFNDNVPQNIRVLTIRAAAEWESAAGKPLFLFDERQGRPAENLNLISITPDAQWQSTGIHLEEGEIENAITFYEFRSQSLTQVEISIRESIISNEKIDKFSVMLHELGHSIGLGHDATNIDSIMYEKLGENESARTLAPIDIERVRTI